MMLRPEHYEGWKEVLIVFDPRLCFTIKAFKSTRDLRDDIR